MNEPGDPIGERLRLLEEGPLYWFRDWPNEEVRGAKAGVYTIWDGGRLIYGGMSRKALFSRLRSHARGVRGGDQFNIYVCDRLVLPSLSRDQIRRVGQGLLSLDDLTREYIQETLGYRFLAVKDETTAAKLETLVKQGSLSAGKPRLNPA